MLKILLPLALVLLPVITNAQEAPPPPSIFKDIAVQIRELRQANDPEIHKVYKLLTDATTNGEISQAEKDQINEQIRKNKAKLKIK